MPRKRAVSPERAALAQVAVRKDEVVRLVLDEGLEYTAAARRIGIQKKELSGWMAQDPHFALRLRRARLTPEGFTQADLSDDWREAYLAGEKEADERLARPGGEIVVDIIADVVNDTGRWEPTVNVLNAGGYVENLPREAVVEVPAVVDAAGVHPQTVGPLPEGLAALCRTQVSIQRLLVEAYRRRSRKLLLQALLLDPCVDSVRRAEAMLDTMLELQKDYLPTFR